MPLQLFVDFALKPFLQPWSDKMSEKKLCRKLLDTVGITSGLPLGDEKQSYVAKLLKVDDDNPHKFMFEHFYTNLDSLDGKTATMIQFSGVLIAVYTAVIGYMISSPGEQLHWIIFGAIIGFLGALLLLSVQAVHWSRAIDFEKREDHAQQLLRIRDSRTIRYRLGWLLNIGSTLILAFVVISIGVRHLGKHEQDRVEQPPSIQWRL
jgi:hypothetical protein